MKSAKILFIAALFMIGAGSSTQAIELQKGDHICLVGNALGERMQHQNYFETMLHHYFPELQLVVRNLCFPGDEVTTRLRSLNFGTPDDHLTHCKASVILFFFGYNESFVGEEGKFTADLKNLIERTKEKNYSGKGPPRIALVSPIAFENTHNPNLPDGQKHNQRLARIMTEVLQVALATDVEFVDLYSSSKKMFSKHKGPHTLKRFPPQCERLPATSVAISCGTH